jgi:hypothetical protein
VKDAAHVMMPFNVTSPLWVKLAKNKVVGLDVEVESVRELFSVGRGQFV